MHSTGQLLSSSFRTIFLSAIAALLMATSTPAAAQNSVPPTAVQAAKMPQFASRLAPPGKLQATRKPGAPSHPRPLDDNDLYDNGPINGNTDAWTINFGFIVSDSFTVANNSSVTGMSFATWLFSGDTIQSVQISITSGPNGGTMYFNDVVDFTQGSCVTNQYGYPVCVETSSPFNVPLNSGTYWVNLQNAVVSNGDPTYWDENSGDGCNSPGCPSQADNNYGTIPSESFTILGNTSSTTCGDFAKSDGAPVAQAKVVTAGPSPDQGFNVLYNFTGGADGANPQTSLILDAAGNLYGTTAAGGSSGEGTVFKLAPSASGWRFARLYSFSGTNGNGPDGPLALASNGIVYGATGGGGSHGDGVLFGLSPSGEILPAVFTNWTERLLYSFTGGSDGSQPGGGLVLDTSGNIYGTAYGGGAKGKGTLYEFSNGSIHVLHAFSGSPGDGANPQGVIQGQGGLFGTTKYGGGPNSGTVFTTAGGYQTLYTFEPGIGGGNPTSLAADQAGNLYVTTTWAPLTCTPGGAMLYQLSYPDWNIQSIWSWAIYGGTESSWVTTDTSGNVYGTNSYGVWGQGEIFQLTCCWTYTPLVDFDGGTYGAMPLAAPVVDAQGNVYGTTSSGGAYGYGVVWELSP